MKVTKYIFSFDSANQRISRRMRIPTLNDSEVFTLYAVNHAPLNCSRQGIHRWAKRCRHPISIHSITDAVVRLKDYGLLQEEEGRISITSQGKEWIAMVRMYLVNLRLR